ncbi:MAG: hypothetical protein ACRDNN_10315, partial [Gaiellaceae bacterium]
MNVSGDIFRVPGPVHHHDPLAEDARDLAVGPVDLLGEARSFPLDPVGRVAAARRRLGGRDEDEERA